MTAADHDRSSQEHEQKPDDRSGESLSADEEKASPPEQQPDENTRDSTPDEKPAAPPSNAPGPPPNGGLQAWLQVLGSWMLFFNTWGILK